MRKIYENMPVLETKKIENMLKKVPQPTNKDVALIEHEKENATKSELTNSVTSKPIENDE